MSRLFLVRHGPTHAKSFVGHRDIPADLSDTAALARLEAALPQDAVIISSDLSRAAATADAIQGSRQRLSHDPSLREIDFGLWDGMHFKDIAAKWPDLSRAFWETPGDLQAPEGESWNQAAARVSQAIDTHLTQGEDLIVVAHFGAILTQVQRALGVSAYKVLAHKIDNLSLTELATQPSWSVTRINHLP